MDDQEPREENKDRMKEQDENIGSCIKNRLPITSAIIRTTAIANSMFVFWSPGTHQFTESLVDENIENLVLTLM